MYLRVAVTDRCNLRCIYCMPERASFVPPSASASELDRLMEAVASALPVNKIRITGGEPTLSPHLIDHVRTARRLVDTVGLTSNGVSLEPLLPALRETGLTRLNISLDAADAPGFLRSSRRDRFAAVLGAIRAASRLGYAPLKLNAVVTTDTDPVALARLAIAEGVHLRFIELMAIGEARSDWAARHVPASAVQQRLNDAGLDVRDDPRRDSPTCRTWTIAGVDPNQTTLGFITAVSHPFCGTCDRLRLTSHGRLHACLFDENGTDLLPLLRSGDAERLTTVIRSLAANKVQPSQHHRHGAMAGIGG